MYSIYYNQKPLRVLKWTKVLCSVCITFLRRVSYAWVQSSRPVLPAQRMSNTNISIKDNRWLIKLKYWPGDVPCIAILLQVASLSSWLWGLQLKVQGISPLEHLSALRFEHILYREIPKPTHIKRIILHNCDNECHSVWYVDPRYKNITSYNFWTSKQTWPCLPTVQAFQNGNTNRTLAWVFRVQSTGTLSRPSDPVLKKPIEKFSLQVCGLLPIRYLSQYMDSDSNDFTANR